MRLMRALWAAAAKSEKQMSMTELLAARNRPIQGMDKKSLGHHLGIQPLFVIMAAGMTFVAAYTIRLATRTTDIQWVKNDVCMNDNLRDKQFQMLNPAGHDLAGAGKNIPDYRKQ